MNTYVKLARTANRQAIAWPRASERRAELLRDRDRLMQIADEMRAMRMRRTIHLIVSLG